MEKSIEIIDEMLGDGINTITATATSLNLGESEKSNAVTYDANYLSYQLSKTGDYYIVTGVQEGKSIVVVPDTHEGLPVREIANMCFRNNEYITRVEIPNSVKRIGYNAFENCINLETVDIKGDDEITVYFRNMCAWNFVKCQYTDNNGNSTTFPGKNMTKIGNDDGCDIYSITLPKNVRTITFTGAPLDGTSSGYVRTQSISASEIHNHASWYVPYDSTVANRTDYEPSDLSSKILVIGVEAFKHCEALKSFTVPNHVKRIPSEAFYYSTSLTTLGFDSMGMLTSIDSFAFRGCSELYELNLPMTLLELGSGAFNFCTKLTIFRIPKKLQIIADGSFANCESLTTVAIGENCNLKHIGENAFFECAELRSIHIPDSVTYIGCNAFSNTSLATADFYDAFGWYAENPVTGLRTVIDFTAIEENQGELVAYQLTNGDTADCNWHKLEQINAPEITLDGAILTIVDPIGFAEKFKVYVNDVHRATIAKDGRITYVTYE